MINEYPKEFTNALAHNIATKDEPKGLSLFLELVGIRERDYIRISHK